METPKRSMFLLTAVAFLSFFSLETGTTFADTTITLDQPVHFTTAEGSDVVLDAGDYAIEPADEWLRVIPSDGQAVDALLLEAEPTTHQEEIDEPTTLSVVGEGDEHILALLLPGGQSLQALGSYSGIRSRASASAEQALARAMRIAQEMANRTGTRPVREWSSLLYGGGGGNQNFNLDCGTSGVMVGAFGQTDAWITRLGITCQRVNSLTGALGADFSRGPVGGFGGRDANPARCPANHVIVGHAGIPHGSYIHHIQFVCGRWNARAKRVREEDMNFSSTDNSILRLFGAPHNFLSGTIFNPPFRCSPGKVGKALRGRRGSSIDSVRFVCDDWNR